MKSSAVKEEVKARLSCFDVLGLPPRPKLQIRCPNPGHDDTHPSAVVWWDGWTCSGCGDGGDVLSLVATVEGLDVQRDFRAVLQSAANRVGISLDGVTEKDRAEWKQNKAQRDAERAAEARKAAARRATESERRARVMAKVWAIVGQSDTYSPAVVSWLRRRAMDPHIAHDAGCRDWSTTLAELVDYFSALSAADKRAAGLCNESGWPWPPLRSLNGETAYAGLAFPVWVPGTPHPMAWRWRYETPRPNPNPRGKPIKCDATCANDTDPAPVLGLGRPAKVSDWPPHHSHNAEPELPAEQWRPSPAPVLEEAPIVFVTEGEPDWLSVSQCLHTMTPSGLVQSAPVVGLCAKSKATVAALEPILAGARVLVAFPHRGSTPRTDGRLSDGYLRDTLREAAPDIPVLTQPVHEKDDCNDRHQRGELAPLVAAQLSKAKAKL